MIAVDTNILVYSHRSDSPFHKAADKALTDLAESGDLWAIPWPCIHEFLAIVTHPRIYDPPTPLTDAIEQVECWLEVPTLPGRGQESLVAPAADARGSADRRADDSRRAGGGALSGARGSGDMDSRSRLLAVYRIAAA